MNQVYKVRASSWSKLFDCAHAWEGVHLLGMHSASSPRALLGTAIHAGTAAFDQARIDGQPISTFDASEATIKALREPEHEVNWRGSDLTKIEAERISLALHTEYCERWSPQYQFSAVELEVKPLHIDCGNGITIILTGQLDRSRIIASSGKARIGDIKSGKNAVSRDGVAETRKHRAQLGTYELLYEHTTGNEIDDVAEVIGMSTSSKRIASGIAQGCKTLMTGDGTSKGLIEYGAAMFASGLFPPNPQSMLCSKQYCPRWNSCKFRG